jgi:replication factor C small subunit
MTKPWREKYRPTTLDEMVGCAQFIADASAWEEGEVPPALLLVGPPGVGKTTAAGVLARRILGEFFDPANYYVTNASDDRGIDFVRELKHIARQGGIGCRRKVILLDEADSFTAPAQKALRQTMETTSSNSVFILTANDIGPIHDAVRDRCLIYNFVPHADEDAQVLFKHIHEREGLPDEWVEHYGSLNRLCGGSLRTSIDLLQGTRKEPDALEVTLRSKSEHLSKASLMLVTGQFEQLANHLRMELAKGSSRMGMLNGLRYRSKHLFDEVDDYYTFMLTWGEFMEKATLWGGDDPAFVDYFVAKLKERNENE